MNENWHKEQAVRDEKLITFLEVRLADAERAVEVAKRQLAYLGNLAIQHSLERLGEQFAEEQDGENGTLPE